MGSKFFKDSKKILSIFIVLIVMSIISVIVKEIFRNTSLGEKKHSKNELAQMTPSILKELANNFNNNTPITVDKDTILTNIVASDNQLIYNYKLVNHSVDQIDTEQFVALSKKSVLERFCTNPDTKLVREIEAASFKYVYYDKNDKFIGHYAITSAQCD